MSGFISSSRAVILVVDDAPDNLFMMNNLFKDSYKVKIANNGEKALKIALSDVQPDLILLDIMMPGMDGYEVCRILKRDPRTMNIPVIFVTARAEQDDEQKGLELGAIDYITKPINPAIVMARVRNHLALKVMIDFLRDQNDWAMADRLAHTLKNLSSSTSFTGLQPLAEKLEETIKSRRLQDEINTRIDAPSLVAHKSLNPNETGVELVTDNREKLDAVCNKLEQLLADGDTEATEFMDENAELLAAAFPKQSHEIDNSIRSLDFGTALAVLRTANGKENERKDDGSSGFSRKGDDISG